MFFHFFYILLGQKIDAKKNYMPVVVILGTMCLLCQGNNEHVYMRILSDGDPIVTTRTT